MNHYRIPASFLFLALSFSAHAAGLNDTGQTLCYDSAGAIISCAAATDDGRYGRDAAAAAGALTKTGAGSAGFDFTKIANNGSALPASATLGGNPADWACTRDNVTGLIWEVKTTSGLRYGAHTYSWYNSNPATNGGTVGNAGVSNCLTAGRCNTEMFVHDVNAAGLCGHTDWRLPKRGELSSIVNLSGVNPAIDPDYFPNTDPSNFWSASPYIGNSLYTSVAWSVNFANDFTHDNGYMYNAFRVRLVRAGQ